MRKAITQKSAAEAYRPLFDLMINEHGLTLIASEMDEIIEAVEKVNHNLSELFMIRCDAWGCEKQASTQGMYRKERGYVCLCDKHSTMARKSEPFDINPLAIEREKNRSPDGTLSND